MLGLYNLIITWLSLIDRPCVGVKEEPAEEESWYCSKCMGRSKKPAKRGRGRGRGRGPGRGKKKMMWTPLSQTEASARKEKIIVWNFVSENRGKMEKEKCCELSTQRTRLNKGKKQIYVNYCVRERGSARGRETNIMWTLVLGNRAHEGKVGNDGSFCVREEGPWFLCQTICLELDNETRSWLYWTLGAPSVTVTLSVNAIICLFSVLWKILTPFLFKCLIYFSTDNCSSRSINMKWHDVNIKYEY